MKRDSAWGLSGLLLALVLVCILASGTQLSAQVRPDVKQLLDDGVSLFQQGKLEEAKQKFEKALLLDITSEEALEWVDTVGYSQLVKVIRSGDDTLAGQMGTLIKLTSTETKRRSSDSSRINEALDAYFGTDDVLKRTKRLYNSVSEHGVYLLPGLVERLGQPEQSLRVAAIQAIIKISDDAVIPLCRALHSSERSVVMGAVAALQNIANGAAVPSLRWLAESTDDPLVAAAANDAAGSIDSTSTGSGAYGLLVSQANHFSLSSSYMNRSYNDPLIWSVDGGSLSHKTVDSWALNELRAQQLIEDAISLQPTNSPALILDACNLMARYSEYRDVRDVVSAKVENGELAESRLADLRSREFEMDQVQSEAYAFSSEILLGALEMALDQRRPQVAVEIIEALRSFITPGSRAAAVPSQLARAQRYDHRGVRFAASECIARMNPRGGFDGSDLVVPNLCEGLVEAGRRVALTIFPGQDDALRAASLLRRANVESFNDDNGMRGLERASSFPKDLVVMAPELADIPTAEVIRRLRGDYRTRRTPIIVMAGDGNFTDAKATYADEEAGVFVVNRSIDPIRLRDDLLSGLFASKEGARQRGREIAGRAAEAILFLASRDSGFDLTVATGALLNGLENPEDSVRIPVCNSVGALGVSRANDALARICEESESNSVDLQVAALRALGDINRGSDSVGPTVERVLDAGVKSDNVRIMRAASRAKGVIGNLGSLKPAVFNQ